MNKPANVSCLPWKKKSQESRFLHAGLPEYPLKIKVWRVGRSVSRIELNVVALRQ